MPLYSYDSKKIEPKELARLLKLTYRDKPGPHIQFCKDWEPVAYIVRSGVVSFIDEIQIPEGVPLKRL